MVLPHAMGRATRKPARQRTVAALVAFSLAATGALGSAAGADDLKDKKNKVQGDIKRARSELNESSAAASKAHAALDRAQAQLSKAQRTLANTQDALGRAQAKDVKMRAKLELAQAKLAQARADLTRAKAEYQVQRSKVGRIAVASATRPSPELLGLVSVLQSRSVSGVIDNMAAVDSMVAKQDRILADFESAKDKMAAREASVEKATNAVAAQQRAAADNLALQRRLKAEAEQAKSAIAGLVGERAAAQSAADRAKSADQSELRKLQAENTRISNMLAARAGKAVNQGNSGPLLRPVTGYVTSAFGWRKHPIYGYWGLHDGTDFHAPCGTPLRASGNGKVVSEYYQSAWGNRLILDLGRVNGHGISVIYNHISSYKVGTGATVRRGDTVAYAGTTGWSTACHLHYTVMVDGKAQDPMKWF